MGLDSTWAHLSPPGGFVCVTVTLCGTALVTSSPVQSVHKSQLLLRAISSCCPPSAQEKDFTHGKLTQGFALRAPRSGWGGEFHLL